MTTLALPSLLDALVEAGLLIPTGVPGLYGRSGAFEDVVARLEDLISVFGREDGAEVLRFPPALARSAFERSGYLKSFPHLAGTVHAFAGDERDHHTLLERLRAGGDWTSAQRPTGVVLTPAACYPVYPIVAARGPLPREGSVLDVASWCFRHEPSDDPTRLQLFRMREYVRIGSPEQVTAFRASWLERGRRLAEQLALPCTVDLANDPFFGRGGRVLAGSQRDQGLKFELLVPVTDPDRPTACLSFNYHQDHFGETFDIRLADGARAHTACVGFGLERLTLALLGRHGLDPRRWPRGLRVLLWG